MILPGIKIFECFSSMNMLSVHSDVRKWEQLKEFVVLLLLFCVGDSVLSEGYWRHMSSIKEQCPFPQKPGGAWKKVDASGWFSRLESILLSFLQCFATIDWVTGRSSGPVKNLHHLSSKVLFQNRWVTRFTWKVVIYWLAVAELRCSLLTATVQSLRRTW